jgi:hypothetical protein
MSSAIKIYLTSTSDRSTLITYKGESAWRKANLMPKIPSSRDKRTRS